MTAHREVVYHIIVGLLIGLMGGMIGYWFMVSSILIKANGASNLYHMPHCHSYQGTVIGNDIGDQYFLTEDAAEDAGFQKAKNCP